MKARRSLLLLFCLAAGCHRTRTIYATTEGVYDPGAPSQLRPARAIDERLRDHRVGGLVVRVEDLIVTNVGSFEVELRNDRERGARVLLDTIANQPSRDLGALAEGTYWGRVRRLGYNQRTFRVRITPGYVDTLDVDLGWVR